MKHAMIRMIKPLFDGRRGQRFLKKVHLFVLYLQNYGMSGDFLVSGELPALKRICAYLGTLPHATVFDVGANVGDYTLSIAALLPANRTIYCFEPSVPTFAELTANIAGLPGIVPVNKGFGDKDEVLVLYSNDVSNKHSSLHKRNMGHWGETYNLKHEEKVEITTLDGFCSEQGIARIDYMKVDVEGNELKLFQGAADMLHAGKIGIIQFEMGVAAIDGRFFFKDLFMLLHEQYRIFRITRKNLFEITSYSEQYEVFITTNYVAVHKSIRL